MRILVLSHDKTLLDPASASAARMAARSGICESLTLLVTAPALAFGQAAPRSSSPELVRLAPNVEALPVRARTGVGLFAALRTAARREARARGATLIVAQDPFEFGLIAWCISRALRIPFQVELHGDFYSTPWWRDSSPLNFLRHYLGKWVMRRACLVRAVSARVARSVVEKCGVPAERVFTLPVDANATGFLALPRSAFLKEQYPAFDTFLLTAGVLNRVKDLPTLLAALARVANDYPGLALVIVGDGPEKEALKNEAHRRGVSTHVLFAPATRNLAPYYTSADAFVLTSRAEGWGRVLVEAMAAGLPCVTTDVGLAGELLKNGENGIVVPVGDEQTLADALRTLLGDAALRTRLGEAGRESIRKLPNPEEVLWQYEESWKRCVD